MKLALYLPTFRNHVTVQELADLTDLAEELDFDSVWTLDRVIVPEASDRGEMQYPFGMMKEFPMQLPVESRRQVVPGLADPALARGPHREGAHRHEHHRHAVPLPGRLRRRVRHHRPPLQRPAQRRRRRGLDARGVRGGERRRTSSRAGTPTSARPSRSARASGPTRPSSTTASSPTSSPRASATSRCRSRTRRSTSAACATPSARPTGSRSTACTGWIGIQDTPRELTEWRTAIARRARGARQVDRRPRHVHDDLVHHHRRGRRPDRQRQGLQHPRRQRAADHRHAQDATRRPG